MGQGLEAERKSYLTSPPDVVSPAITHRGGCSVFLPFCSEGWVRISCHFWLNLYDVMWNRCDGHHQIDK